jgi:hypothetical protein
MIKRALHDIFNLFKRNKQTVSHHDFMDMEMKRLAADLDQKRKEAIARLGEKWILHPNHYVKRKNITANTLGSKTV